jgi:hypothetical protein
MNKYTLNELLDFGVSETRAKRFLRGIERLTPAEVKRIKDYEVPPEPEQTEGPKQFERWTVTVKNYKAKNCKICGTKFKVKSGAEKFCSIGCRRKGEVIREVSYGKSYKKNRQILGIL